MRGWRPQAAWGILLSLMCASCSRHNAGDDAITKRTSAVTLDFGKCSKNRVAVGVGDRFSCALLSDGTVECWGLNSSGQLGNGIPGDSSLPVAVSRLSGTTAIAVGEDHACAVIAGGAVVCWGANGSGQLGNGTQIGSGVPAPVSGLTGVVGITAGFQDTCAVRSDGTVACWGDNSLGQGGNLTQSPLLTPTPVPSVNNATAVSLGDGHACALIGDGTARCWGDNRLGGLGDPARTAPLLPPIPVPNLSGLTTIAAGFHMTCALLSDGTVRCWGDDYYGGLGDGKGGLWDGNLVFSATPVSPIGLAGVQSVFSSAGLSGACAVLSTGNAACWGHGSFGDSQFIPTYSVPTVEPGLAGLPTIGVNLANGCGVDQNGSLECWGVGDNGALGNGTQPAYSLPVVVPGGGLSRAGLVCRPPAGACDQAERCSGTDSTCPADQVLAAGQLCRPVAGVCDVPETCDGTSVACPPDQFVAAGQTCRAGVGSCDVAEVCSGAAPSCPPDALLSAGTACGLAADAGATSSCSGISPVCGGVLGSNLITNGDFSLGQFDWHVVEHSAPLGVNKYSVSNGRFCLELADTSSVTLGWPDDISRTLTLNAGDSYTLSYQASTTAPLISFEAKVGQFEGGAPGANYPNEPVIATLGSFVHTFTLAATNPDAGVAFNILGGPATVCVSNVSLTKVGQATGGADGGAGTSDAGQNDDAAVFANGGGGNSGDDGGTDAGTTGGGPGGAGGAGGTGTCVPGTTCYTAPDVCSSVEQTETCPSGGGPCPTPTAWPVGGCGSALGSTAFNLNGGEDALGGVTFTFPGPLSSDSGVAEIGAYQPSSLNQSCPPLAGFEIRNAPQFWEMHTSAFLPAGTTVCVGYDSTQIGTNADECHLALAHGSDTQCSWSNISKTPDICPSNGQRCLFPHAACQHKSTICGMLDTRTLSPFAIFIAAPASTPVVTVPQALTVAATGPTGAVVSYAASATDPKDGPLAPGCTPSSGSVFPIGTTTVTCEVTNSLGIFASASFTITVRNGPAWRGVPTAPMVAYATSTAGAKVTYAAPTATDAASGVALPVTCTPGSGSTFQPGKTTVTCTASNVGSTTFTVWVQYQAPTDGTFFLQPINPDGTSIFKQGSTISVKFKLLGASAAITNLTAHVLEAKVSNSVTGNYLEAVSTANGDSGNTFRYDPSGGQYVFNLSTKAMTTGTWSLRADLGDEVDHSVALSLR